MLSNPEKRARYDQFGHAGMSGRPEPEPAADSADSAADSRWRTSSRSSAIFSEGHFSGGSYRTSSSGGRRVNRGTDIRVRVKLSLAEIASGTVKKLKINKQVACPKCGGPGPRTPTPIRLVRPATAGYVNRIENTFFGRMQTQSVCPACGGTGKVITNPCDE